MDIIGKIIGIAIIGTIMAIMLKPKVPEFAMLISIITGIVIFYLIYDSLRFVVNSVEYIIAKTNVDKEVVSIVLKICGIGIVSEYFCNIIEDAKESAIAKKAEMATKVVIFVMTIPLVIKVVENIWGLF